MEPILLQLNSMLPQFMARLGVGMMVFARLLGFMRFAPVFYRKEVPTIAKISFAMIFAVAMTPVLPPQPAQSDGFIMVALALNIAVGAMIGYMARLILTAIEAGGDMINMQMGLSSAMIMDPSSGSQVSVMGRIIGLLGMVIFIHIGGIYWILTAFMRTFEIFPIYATVIPLDRLVNMDYLISLSSNVLYVGLQIASPILLATLGQDIILGVISKTAPQVNVFQLSFLFKPVFGAAIMLWILPMLLGVINDYFLSFAHIF